ncbi:MAG: nucleotidyltransferase domain-containing protein [Theionarchaea archaeon]|nr:nucleotidyltransferase domain-containing protein [Theionarchaea archaeon]
MMLKKLKELWNAVQDNRIRERYMKRVIELRKKERENLLEGAEKYLEKLKKTLGPLTGIVFGSVSRGDFNDASDIDIVVIANRLPDHPVRRLEVLLSPWAPGIDPKGYTPSELELMKKKEIPLSSSFWRKALS